MIVDEKIFFLRIATLPVILYNPTFSRFPSKGCSQTHFAKNSKTRTTQGNIGRYKAFSKEN